MPWTSRGQGVFSTFPRPNFFFKKCEDESALGVGTERGLHLIHAVRL